MALGTPTELYASGAGAASHTTSGVVPTPGALLLVSGEHRASAAISEPSIADDSAGAWTWTALESASVDAGSGARIRQKVWAAIAPSGWSAELDITCAATGAAKTFVTVTQYTGASLPTNAEKGESTTGDPAATLPSSPAATSSIYAAAAFAGTTTPTTPTGYTLLSSGAASTDLIGFVWYDPPAPEGDTVSIVTTNTRGSLVLVEIPEAAASGSGTGAISSQVALAGTGSKAGVGTAAIAPAVALGGVGSGGDAAPPGPEPPPPDPNRGIVSQIGYGVTFRLAANSLWTITNEVRALSVSRRLNVFPGGVEAGAASILLDDSAGMFSPLVNSYHGGLFRPNLEVDITATYTDPITAEVASYFLFRGLVDGITVDPLVARRVVTVDCRDRWKYLQHRQVSTSMMIGWPVNSVLATALSAASIDNSQHSIDAIADVLPWAWFQDRVLSTVMGEFIEAGGYAAYISADGVLRVRDRYFDLGGVAVASYSEVYGLSWGYDDDEVLNRVTMKGIPRTYVNSVQAVAAISEPISIPASSSITFFLQYQDPRNQEDAPATEMVVPVTSMDVLVNASSGGGGTDRTSTASWSISFFGEAAKCVIFNGNGNINWLTKFRLRGKPIQRNPTISVRVDVNSSQVVYGLKDTNIETRLFTSRDLLERRVGDVAELFAGPAPQLTISNRDDLPGALSLDLANVVVVTNSHSGLFDEQFTIMGLDHQVRADDVGWVHDTKLDLMQARGYGVFILDTDMLDVDRLSR